MGFYQYQKLNMKDMVEKYNYDEWYEIDIIIDWREKKQQVSIWVNGKFKTTEEQFFSSDSYIGSV